LVDAEESATVIVFTVIVPATVGVDPISGGSLVFTVGTGLSFTVIPIDTAERPNDKNDNPNENSGILDAKFPI
jgi:hypothetical protein